jgi:hypothetical protein
MKRSRLENWANWAFDNLFTVIVPGFLVLGVLAGLYLFLTDDDLLRDRSTRHRVFEELLTEMKALEVPPQTGIGEPEMINKPGTVLIWTQYRSELPPDKFAESMHQSLLRRGWISYRGEPDDDAMRTYTCCRHGQEATLTLSSKSFPQSDGASYWHLYFAGKLRGHTVLRPNQYPETCVEKSH